VNVTGNLKLREHHHRYQGIANTIVQLLCLYASGVMAAARAAQSKQPDSHG
jgi:hypothetical protein